VSVIAMTAALDAGHLLAVAEAPIGPRETAAELEGRLATLGAPLVLEAIDLLHAAVAAGADPATVGTPQDGALATRAPRLTKADGVIDWSAPAEAIERLRRAVEPWPRATTWWRREGQPPLRLVIDDAVVAPGLGEPQLPGTVLPGTVLPGNGGRLLVACGGGTALEILRLVPEGRRGMSAADFLRGHLLGSGTRLG
jgi:methionyl-tRNA formyltransferase